MRPGAFSLTEVVIAVAIAGGSLAVILGLLPVLTRQAADSREAQEARQLAGAVRAELVGRAGGGLTALAASIPLAGTQAASGLAFVAERSGTGLRLRGAGEDGFRPFYEIRLRRWPSGPLAYSAGREFLAVSVMVSWPADGGASARQSVTFNVGVAP